MSAAVPVIDLTPLRAGHAGAASGTVRAIGEACRTSGFFQVVGHGVPAELIARFDAEQRAFFALPQAKKDAVARDAANAFGYYDRELTKNVRDWKEVFDFGCPPHPELPDGDPRDRGVDGVNRWPAGRPAFRAVMLEYLAACEALAFRLLDAFARGLGEAPDTLSRQFRPRHSSFLRLNHYPPCAEPAPADAPDAPLAGHLGVNRHTDAGALTILYESGGSGLQVRHAGGWRLVEVVPDALVVNVGDMAQVWSNDHYRAPLHRVLCHPTRDRFSAPFFFNPDYECRCAPLPCVSAGRPSYRPIHWGEYRRLRAAGDYQDLGEEIQLGHYRLA